MAEYKIIFPRWQEDIATKKRTLAHLPDRPGSPVLAKGDVLLVMREPDADPIVAAEIVEVSTVNLVNSLAVPGEWIHLNLRPEPGDIDSYRRRWDATNPEWPWTTDPIVTRVVFRYLPTPAEFGVAS